MEILHENEDYSIVVHVFNEFRKRQNHKLLTARSFALCTSSYVKMNELDKALHCIDELKSYCSEQEHNMKKMELESYYSAATEWEKKIKRLKLDDE